MKNQTEKPNWKNVYCSKNLVEHQTANGICIKLPKSKLKFWTSLKLVREVKGGISIGYLDTMTFKVFQNGAGKHNRFDKIHEEEISAKEWAEYFAGSTEQIGQWA